MHPELSVALNFLVSHLYNKLPRRRIDVFAEELEKALKKKFHEHWYPDEPFKGSGYRSIRIVEGKLDPAFRVASQLSGLTLEEILEHLPKGLTIWIDPDEVSYRIGETGQVTILYFNKRTPAGSVPSCLDPLSVTPNSYGGYSTDNMSNMEQLNYLFNCFGSRTETGFNREADLSVGFEKLKLDGGQSAAGRPPYVNSHSFQSPLQVNNNSQMVLGLNKSKNSNCFTAAAFAQTKFGSTKMKNHSSHQARPTRLTATTAELHSRLNIAAQMNALSARSPGSFLPFIGFPSQTPWPLERQASAPSSCLNSPNGGYMPMSSNQLFSHLMQPSPGLSRHSPNESLASPASTSSIHSPGNLSLLDQSILKQDLQFAGRTKNHSHLQTQISLSPDKLNSSQTLTSSSTDSPNSEKSLPGTSDMDWSNYVSNYPNLQHLLVAN